MIPRGIWLYIHYTLRDLRDLKLEPLISHAQGSFTWALVASRYIRCEAVRRKTPGERFQELTSSPRGFSSLYKIILDAFEAQHSGVLLAVASWYCHTPRPLLRSTLMDYALTLLHPESQINPLRTAIEAFCGVLCGSDNHSAAPFPVSFIDFLGKRSCSAHFWNRAQRAHVLGLKHCMDTMVRYLRFNIAEVATSFSRNQDIPDFVQRVATSIPPHLAYCCRLWPLYAAVAMEAGASCPSVESFLKHSVLEWLEVMSLIRCSPEEALAPLTKVTVRIPRNLNSLQDSYTKLIFRHCHQLRQRVLPM